MRFPGASRILVTLALTNLVAYAARNALFTVYPDLHAQFGINEAQYGFLQTVFMLPHAAATLGFGWAGDTRDRRKVIAVGMMIASIAGAAGTFGESYFGLAASRALVGLGTAAVVPVANSILAQLYDGPMKASRMAIFNLGLFLGGVAGFGVGIAVGFPAVVFALALPGVALSALLMMLPVPPLPVVEVHVEPPSLKRSLKLLLAESRILLRIPTLRWVMVSTTVMAFAAGGFNAWLKELLVRKPPDGKGMSEGAAGILLGLALVAGLSGIIVGAKIADRLRVRRAAGRLWTIVLGMGLATPCAALAVVVPNSVGLYAIGMATMFFMSWYHAPMAATVDDLAPENMKVSAQALVIFTMHMVGTAPSSWIVGLAAETYVLPSALWIPTVALGLAALAMVMATRTFAADEL